VEAADQTGRLRGILDAVRSHRIVDDFSSRWSYAREDLRTQAARQTSQGQGDVRRADRHHAGPRAGKRSAGQRGHERFLALLDARNRQIVVLLSSGVTRKTEIANILGYANHSAVSKRLAQIRRTAEAFFDEN
jgi:hypothetical protein